MLKKFWPIFFGAPLLAAVMVAIELYYFIAIWKYDGPTEIFNIRRGEGFSSINFRLEKKGYIPSSNLFHRYVKFQGLLTKFKAGSYKIKADSNMLSIIDTLVYGKPVTLSVTIPEGKNIYEVGKLLHQKKVTNYDDFIKLAKDPLFTKKLNIPADRIEGYLYPDTYYFSKGTTPRMAIETMVNEFKNKIRSLNLSDSPLSLHQIVTLASIVEKETGAEHERPLIAGVFHNRLRKKMRLQSDPTTIYGIYENFNGNLKRKHLQQKTPYNTYRISGLPIGPISNPGIESIKAVLSPEKHDYIYFVSQNDGTHIFSESYKGHLKAVEKYQKTRKNRVGKSWRDFHKRKK